MKYNQKKLSEEAYANSELVSIIVPIYNTEKYLQPCIDSLLNQTYRNLEIILVDDGSTDNSGEICDFYASKDLRIKVIHKENGGLVSARKAGLKRSTGNLITVVDSDDWIDACMVEKMVEKQQFYNADIVLCGIIMEWPDRRDYISEWLEEKLYLMEDRNCPIYSRFFVNENDRPKRGMRSNIYSRLYKRNTIYDSQMAVDDRINNGEDDACFFPALLNANRVYAMKECMYHFQRFREDSMSVNPKMFSLLEIELLKERLDKCIKGHFYEKRLQDQLDVYMFSRMQCYAHYVLHISTQPIYIVPYDILEKHSKVVVYGAGNVGKCYINQLKQSDYCTLTGWIDKSKQGFYLNENIVSIVELKNLEYDYILMATAKEEIVASMRSDIEKYERDSHKILWKKPQVLDGAWQTFNIPKE